MRGSSIVCSPASGESSSRTQPGRRLSCPPRRRAILSVTPPTASAMRRSRTWLVSGGQLLLRATRSQGRAGSQPQARKSCLPHFRQKLRSRAPVICQPQFGHMIAACDRRLPSERLGDKASSISLALRFEGFVRRTVRTIPVAIAAAMSFNHDGESLAPHLVQKAAELLYRSTPHWGHVMRIYAYRTGRKPQERAL
jgi:hypothetical protein